MTTLNPPAKFYSKEGLWSLFLMCAFPLHIWTIILAFRDFSWVAERTDAWDAVGVVSYGLIFTFVESIAVFLVMAVLGLLISRKWGEKKRLALLSALVVIVSLWAMVSHLYFLRETSLAPEIISFFVQTSRPLRMLYVFAFLIVAPTFLIPAFFILRSEKVFALVREGIERLSLLMILYLILDIAALVIVVARNI